MKISKIFELLLLLLFLVFLPLFLFFMGKKNNIFTEAFGKKAEIEVDVNTTSGILVQPWRALAQGGEEKENMFSAVSSEISDLKPAYIRIDHIYDFYDLVQKNDGVLSYNFQKLDQIVDEILKTGAKPFLALSYMPTPLSSGDIVSAPADWLDWKNLVQRTIEHYSGLQERNINGVYYEVWNEPDLFGQWKTRGEKNYLDLYYWSALAAQEAKNVNQFKLGGPATTGFYENWFEGLLKLSNEKNLKLDFVSWHSYHLDPKEYKEETEKISSILKKFGQIQKEKIISEWGSDSENNSYHDGNFDAAHQVAVFREILGWATWAFSFEIKDGPSPSGQKLWGRWGLLTHESVGVTKKPHYWSQFFLSKLDGYRLYLTGEGTWVKAIAAKKDQKISLLLTNFDVNNRHDESFPVTFKNMVNSRYRVEKNWIDRSQETNEIEVTDGRYQETIYLEPNQILLIEILPI